MEVKRIGVLTSGGDAPGMNAAVRAVVRYANRLGIEVMGIRRGYTGLINGDMYEMSTTDVMDYLRKGGTVLGTARCPEFKEEAGVQQAVRICQYRGLDGVVVIGGDGSYRGAADLSAHGVPCVGLPGTIDNDIASTDYTIGYDTALNTAMEMIDKLRDTSASHNRCSVVEVMGRHAGHIALNTSITCGGTYVIVPELEFSMDKLVEKILIAQNKGKSHNIVLVAEGIGDVDRLAKEIEERTGVESRATILGHVQRGGSPTQRDRLVASIMGFHAVELLSKGIGNRVVGLKNDKLVDYDIQEALQMKKELDMELFEVAHCIAL